MIDKKTKSQVSTVILLGLISCFLCALFPPRHVTHGGVTSTPRIFLFSEGIDVNEYKNSNGTISRYPAEIDAGHLIAECILICSLCGFALLYIFADDG